MWTGYISFKKRMWCKETKHFTGPCMCNVQLAFRWIDKQASAWNWNCLHWGRKTTVAYSLIFSVITGYQILSELIVNLIYILSMSWKFVHRQRYETKYFSMSISGSDSSSTHSFITQHSPVVTNTNVGFWQTNSCPHCPSQ